jgi:hypothetical protein
MRRRRDDSVAAAAAETEWSIFLSAAHGRADVVAQLVACGKLTAMLALPLDPAAVRDNVLLVQVPRLLPERSVCFEKSRKVLAKQCSCLLALILRPGLGDWVLPLPPLCLFSLFSPSDLPPPSPSSLLFPAFHRCGVVAAARGKRGKKGKR